VEPPADPGVALVFSGGGAKGAWEAGVAAAFLERGVSVRLAAGSSAGALNAVMVADGRVAQLEALWRSVTRDQVYALRPSVFFAGLLPGWLTLLTLNSAGSLLDPQGLRDLLTASLDLPRVRASPVRVVVVTTDLVRRVRRIFDNDTVTVEALMAATAVPGAFPPVVVDGDVLVDGGLTGRAPVLEVLESGVPVGRVVVAMTYATEERADRPRTLRRVLEESFETAMVHQIGRDLELARLRHPGVDIQVVEPSAPLALRPLDFEPDALGRAFARGRADGHGCLDAWR
jgi:NTE family protein